MTEPIQKKVSLKHQPPHFDREQMSSVIKPMPISSQPTDASPACPPNSENNGSARPSHSGPNMGRSLGQIFIILVVLLMLVNIPFNSYRAGLAQLMPQSSSIVIWNGSLLKGSGPEIYVVDNYKLRQVSSESLKEHFGRNRPINQVEDNLLAQFGQGPPIYRLLQCRTRSGIYAVEDGYKRRLLKPPTNPANSWDKAGFVACSYLEHLPDGPPIRDLAER